ncbi:virion protein [Deerpox virus W-848-83]|uniref:Virion protein n=1 Tax=Deerpox virus (strain Mule deer/United States/W-848-83/1983) TaxID=305674 RepID=Q08FR2_DPV83|nr:Virion protein [Deerpox virus W-848-83]ABI99245.1 virion protein [Deerpox virus W-848-83]
MIDFNISIINDDRLYPRFNNYENNIFLLIGNHNEFINNILKIIKKYPMFFCEYEVYPDELGILNLNLSKSSHYIKTKPVTVEEFISMGNNMDWCSELEIIKILDSFEKILIYDIVYYNILKWKRILVIQCPQIKNILYESFMTNPFIVSENKDIFNNLILCSSINSMFYNIDQSSFKNLLDHINYTTGMKAINIITKNNPDTINIIKSCYDRNKFRAFAYAWFNSQINNNILENEKVERQFVELYKLI